MNKALAFLAAGVILAVMVTGCATPQPLGLIYTEVKLPVAAGGPVPQDLKMGTAECQSVLGLVALGDASITAAKRNGGIEKIYYVDWEVENILGFIGKYRCIVYGE